MRAEIKLGVGSKNYAAHILGEEMILSRRFSREVLLFLLPVAVLISLLALVKLILRFFPEDLADHKLITEGIIVNFLWTIFLLVLAYTWSLFPLLRGRRSMLRFFGINEKMPNISIFFSDMIIRPGGTLALERTTEGYIGHSISLLEYDVALELQSELSQKPVAGIPEKIQDTIGLVFEIRRTRVKVTISPRPLPDKHEMSATRSEEDFSAHWKTTASQIEEKVISQDDTIIIIGSSIYNSIAKWYLDVFFHQEKPAYDHLFYFGKNEVANTRLMFLKSPRHGVEDFPPTEGGEKEQGLILKFRHNEKTVFVCAGISGWATASTALFFLKKWRAIYKVIREQDFGIVLTCSKPVDTTNGLASIREPEFLFATQLDSKADPIPENSLRSALSAVSWH